MKSFSVVKIFAILTLCTSLIFILLSVISLQVPISNKVESINKRTFTISTEQITGFFEMEIPFFTVDVQANRSISSYFLLLSPSEWVKSEFSILQMIDNESKKSSAIDDAYDLVVELAPPESFFQAEKNNVTTVENSNNQEPVQTNNLDKKVVFIYHTHNRESFLPELKTKKANEAYDPNINVTLVGKKLSEYLNKLGIGTVISTKDYWTELEDYSLSYKHSFETVQAALKKDNDYEFIFDIHRDASVREKTTRTINGKEYAAIYFVIGEANKNYEQNKKLAEELHQKLEELYPGLSKGILSKQKTIGSNGDYNQSISTKSLTIEIGGVYNTLTEEYRTTEALARAIADLYWDAIKVDANPSN
ncbi:MAG: stage II sporulation protein P [Vulcanibacillus sp.]